MFVAYKSVNPHERNRVVNLDHLVTAIESWNGQEVEVEVFLINQAPFKLRGPHVEEFYKDINSLMFATQQTKTKGQPTPT